MTLIELMIVVSIVGILAAIAYPSYRQSILKSNRSDGKITLSKAAQDLEKCFTQVNTYIYNAGNCPAIADLAAGRTSEARKYLIKVNNTDALHYILTATPQNDQVDDAQCATFTLSETGARTSAPNTTSCW